MFSISAAYVIACNRTFDTSLENGVISPMSTQGQFTKRFFRSIEEFDSQIEKSLDGCMPTKLSKDQKPYGKRNEFPIGTVAAVSSNGQVAYLVAICSLNEHKVASSSTENILDALPATWEFIRTKGEMGPLCCPILGSAFSRVSATREHLN